MSQETRPFYHTQAWLDCRDAFLKSKRGLCELCLKEGLYTPAKVVHHRVHLNAKNMNDPEISLNWDNLMALCQDHHAFVHRNDYDPITGQTARRYRFDEYGNLITFGD